MKKMFLLLFFFTAVAQAEQPGLTDTEIVFGQSAAFSGSSAALGAELWRGSQAYFDHVNSKGGVHGRKIKVVSIDDGYEGSRTMRNTIKLVQKDKVFGLFGYVGTPTIVKALPVIQKFSNQDLFLFANFTGAQPQREAPHKDYVFNIRSSYRQETAGIVENLLKVGHKKIGVFIQYDAYGRSGADGVMRALAKKDLKLNGEVTYRRGAKFSESMIKQVEALKKEGATAVVSIGSYAACAAFIRDARMSGFEGPIANVSFVGADALLSLLLTEEKKVGKKLTNRLINSQVVPPWNDKDYALVREYTKIMKGFSGRTPANEIDSNYKSNPLNFVSLEGFLNAKVLVEVLRRAPKKLTRKNFFKAVESLSDFDAGIKHKISFSPNKHQSLDAVFFTTVQNGKYATIKDWKAFKK